MKKCRRADFDRVQSTPSLPPLCGKYSSKGMLLGAIIGFERESADKPAGLRTHMLVAGAAALLVALGDVVIVHFQVDMGNKVIQSDPVRV